MDTKQLEEAVLLAVEGLKLDGGWSAEEKNCGDYVKDIAGDAIRAVFSSAALAAPAQPAAPAQAGEYPEPSPTAGMSIAQRILHVGGRNNAAGYVEFGSTQAVDALVCQVLRDRAATWRPIATAPIDGKKILLRSKRGRIADGLWSAANSSAGFWTWAYVCQEPIEWMPLPASPAAIAAQQGGANG